MTQQTIFLGTYANDGTGDDLLKAFTKVNNNFNDLYRQISHINGENIGAGQGIFVNDVAGVLRFKSFSSNGSISITASDETVTLGVGANLQQDLSTNGHNIIGNGDVRTTVYGIDVRSLQNQVQTIISQGLGDQGSFSNPLQQNFDMGPF
jgi:hypothetical protein